jgi:hypothetical protein
MKRFIINKGDNLDKIIKNIKLPYYISLYSTNYKLPYFIKKNK